MRYSLLHLYDEEGKLHMTSTLLSYDRKNNENIYASKDAQKKFKNGEYRTGENLNGLTYYLSNKGDHRFVLVSETHPLFNFFIIEILAWGTDSLHNFVVKTVAPALAEQYIKPLIESTHQ